jgi:hypothetical protein
MQTFRDVPAHVICISALIQKRGFAIAACLTLMVSLSSAGQSEGMAQPRPNRPAQSNEAATHAAEQAELLHSAGSNVAVGDADSAAAGSSQPMPKRKLIVIGFMGGNVGAGNLVHREAQLIHSLQLGYPAAIRAGIFANRHGDAALKNVLQLLDEDRDGRLSDVEKSTARIVIFGHSWGASETVALASRLDKLHIPVLLTIQVDSVQKQSQNDGEIPSNVREAVNFYQSEGLLRGRKLIVAKDPAKTKILGNYESSYRQNPISCDGFPWYARAFMKRHIQIENDPQVWDRIEGMILAKIM